MRIACFIRSDSVFLEIGDVLARYGFDSARFIDETGLLHGMCRHEFALVLAEGGGLVSGDSIAAWMNCRAGVTTPVVLLSAAPSPALIAMALDAGADDVIELSCAPQVLAARLRAVLRRHHRHFFRRTIELAGFELDLEKSLLLDRGTRLDLTTQEFSMAWMFFSAPAAYLSREAIATALWGTDSEIASRTIEQHVYKLRKKLKLGAERGVRIRAVYTGGYRLEVDDGDAASSGDGLSSA